MIDNQSYNIRRQLRGKKSNLFTLFLYSPLSEIGDDDFPKVLLCYFPHFRALFFSPLLLLSQPASQPAADVGWMGAARISRINKSHTCHGLLYTTTTLMHAFALPPLLVAPFEARAFFFGFPFYFIELIRIDLYQVSTFLKRISKLDLLFFTLLCSLLSQTFDQEDWAAKKERIFA